MVQIYKCVICNLIFEQISHHKSHLKTQKHKDKKEIFKSQLKSISSKELIEKV